MEIAHNWFFEEPAFYSLFCMQKLQENARLECEIRVGEGRIEYNPLLLAHKNYKEVELLLRIEIIRLFLKHPYERRPEGCRGEVIALGSDCTIADGYCLLKEAGMLKGPGAYHLPIGQCYEWYCKAIQNKEDSGNDDNETNNRNTANQKNNDRSALWHDDTLRQSQINELIERTSDWGTLSGDLVEQIKASTQTRLNSRIVFQGFKSNLLSTHRRMTRMRPNRRTGFLQMGSRREIQAHILIAVDCSCSIEEETLSRFISLLNRLFRKEEFELTLLQFDAQVLSVEPMTRIYHSINILGRGGTNFQPVIDFFFTNTQTYDGLMILTDGEAPPPTMPQHHIPLLWVCAQEAGYKQHHEWMEKSGRVCWI